MKYTAIYLIAINIIGIFTMAIDKRKAKKHKWRISEKAIFIIAILGGAVGVYTGMQQFRHKTQHKQFVYGIPAIMIVQLAIAIYILWFL